MLILVNLLMMKSLLLLLLRDLTQFRAQLQRSEDLEMTTTVPLLGGTRVPIVETTVLIMTRNAMVVMAVTLTVSVLGVTLHGKETAGPSVATG